MILVISAKSDVHAQAVMSALVARGGEIRLLDLSQYPVQSSLTIETNASGPGLVSTWSGPESLLDFGECKVVWWRRPQPFEIDPAVRNGESRNFALVEAHSAFAGLWLTLDTFWINHPTRDEEAARKVLQLKVAQEVGLRIPATRITNDVEKARDFVAKMGLGCVVYKAFAGTENAWRETRIIRPEEMSKINDVRLAPVIFQEYIPAGEDLRITIVGERLFPAAIYTKGTEYEADFRMVITSAKIEETQLPQNVIEALLALMRRLGLVYGAVDMRRTPDGEHVFLEINPAGQWLFIEERTGQPITEALADLMLSRDEPATQA